MKNRIIFFLSMLMSALVYGGGMPDSPEEPAAPPSISEDTVEVDNAVDSGEMLMLVKYTSFHMNQTYENSSYDEIKESASAPGIDLTIFSGSSSTTNGGLYLSTAFIFPTEYNYFLNGSQDFSYFIDENSGAFPWGIDMVFGYGHLFTVIPSFVVLAGGGLHMNGLFLDDAFLLLGPGAEINAILYLTKTININLGFMAAYDWNAVSGFDTKKGGFSWGISAGLGLGY